jgi:hypothetical protein
VWDELFNAFKTHERTSWQLVATNKKSPEDGSGLSLGWFCVARLHNDSGPASPRAKKPEPIAIRHSHGGIMVEMTGDARREIRNTKPEVRNKSKK